MKPTGKSRVYMSIRESWSEHLREYFFDTIDFVILTDGKHFKSLKSNKFQVWICEIVAPYSDVTNLSIGTGTLQIFVTRSDNFPTTVQ